jgi:outer membrane lipoprotein-sorting protein
MRVFKITFFAAFFVFFTGVLSVSETSAQPIRAILKRMDEHNKSLTSLRADVTMVKHNPQLNVSDTSFGATSYLPASGKRGRYVRIDWTKPVQEHISVIGESYELYRPRLNQVIVGQVGKAKNNASVGGALSFMNMNKKQLEANYDIVYLGEEKISGGISTWRLQLTPTVATSYKIAELWVDADGMPRQAKIVEQNNDTTTVLLSNLKKNLTLNGSIFKLDYPKNAKKIKA